MGAAAADAPGADGSGEPGCSRSASASPTRVALTVCGYALSSLGGVFVNKACLSAFQFHHTPTLLLCQLLVSVSALTVLRFIGAVHIPPRPMRELVMHLCVPAVLFVANVGVGLGALGLVNVPMFSAFRRLSVLAVLAVERIVLRRTPSRRALLCVAIMAVGSCTAGLGDVTFDPLGYTLVLLNNIVTAGSLVAIKRASIRTSLSALALFYYVSALALPFVAALAIFCGDLRAAVKDVWGREELRSGGFVVALGLSSASAFSVNIFTNLCTQLTSPLTTAITGQMKNVLQTVLGVFAFGYIVTPLNVIGLAIALLGSCLFARVKFLEARAAHKRDDEHHKRDGHKDVGLAPFRPATADITAVATLPSADAVVKWVPRLIARLLKKFTKFTQGKPA